MSSTLVVPFNFRPDSTTIRTASYTIPAGKYARITPLPSQITTSTKAGNLNASTSSSVAANDIGMQLNSSFVACATNIVIPITIVYTAGNVYYHNVSLPSVFRSFHLSSAISTGGPGTSSDSSIGIARGGTIFSDANWAASVQTTTTITSSNAKSVKLESHSIPDRVEVRISVSGAGQTTFTFSLLIRTGEIFHPFWVKSGDVITVPSGFRYSVEEYNEII